MPRSLRSFPGLHTAKTPLRRVAACAAVAVILAGATVAQAGPREQAKQIFDRITGTPPTAEEVASMAAQISAGDAVGAALFATRDSAFYNGTLKNFIAPATNREQSVFVPLNDYTATFIGMVRDDVPMNTLLSADLVYVGADNQNLPVYSPANNDHYEQMEQRGLDLRQVLEARTQSSVTGLPANATAGLMTTRGAAQSFFVLGTNRAMLRFTLMAHLCNDLEQVADTTRAPDRIRQDVSRSPGGDSRLFLNNCIGCHSGMDPLAQAFAYYNYNEDTGQIEYTEGQVQSKYYNNEDTFPFGFRTPDDSWTNYWRQGRNVRMGWDPSLPGSGQGAKSLGQELGNSREFASCQVRKVFRNVCLRQPTDAVDRTWVTNEVSSFSNNGYSLRQVFADAAVYCMGE